MLAGLSLHPMSGAGLPGTSCAAYTLGDQWICVLTTGTRGSRAVLFASDLPVWEDSLHVPRKQQRHAAAARYWHRGWRLQDRRKPRFRSKHTRLRSRSTQTEYDVCLHAGGRKEIQNACRVLRTGGTAAGVGLAADIDRHIAYLRMGGWGKTYPYTQGYF